jgi:acyl-CoA synthetase (AMP-forming)/AMP-acid ligase II
MQFETIGQFTEHWAQATPWRVALVHGDARTNYAALHEQVLRCASALRAAGIGPGDRAGHMGLNHPDYVVLMQACARIGAVLAPINWRLVANEVGWILKDAGIRLLLADRAFAAVVEAAAGEAGIERILFTDSGTAAEPDFRSWIAAHAPDPQVTPTSADDVVLQLYTSGTTGFPKGALLTHRSLLGTIGKGALTGESWSLWDEDDVCLVAMPLFHIGGTGWALHALEAGATAVILARPDIDAIIDTIEAERVTKAFAVPAVLNMIINHPRAKEADLSSMTELLYGASPIPLEVLKGAMAAFRNASFIQCYGATETSGTVVYLPPADHDVAGNERMRGCGKPFPDNAVRIVDADGHEVPRRTVGEIAVRSVSVMKGYHNNRQATEKAIRDGWYLTGDAGWMDEDGYLFIHDRVKDMIVSGAENIYPAEVENALAAHPAVKDSAVIGVPDPRWGEAVKAIVVLKDGAAASAEEIMAHCRQHIAGYKCPKSVDFVAELPRNPSGKILKKELRKPYWEGHERQVA